MSIKEADEETKHIHWQGELSQMHLAANAETDLGDLSSKNFMQYAIGHYNNPNCISVEEFANDLNIIVHIKKLIKRYQKNESLKLRLIINHLVTFYNVFSPTIAGTRMLAFRLQDNLPQLKPLLMCIGRWPDQIPSVNGRIILSSEIALDQNIIDAIRSEFKGLKR